MHSVPVQQLLRAVRRHVWAQRAAGAVRRAVGVSCLSLVLALGLHVLGPGLPSVVPLAALVLPLLAALGWAAWQAPGEAACAMWADRHLGGASAFTTLRDCAAQAPPPEQQAAHRWLQRWAVAQVPEASLRLAQQPSPWRGLRRPVLSLGVLAALAVPVWLLAPASPPGPEAGVAARATGLPLPPEAAALTVPPAPAAEPAAALAQALRTAAPRETAAGAGTSPAAASAAGEAASAGAARGADDDPAVPQADASPAARDASAAAAPDAREPAALARAGSPGSGSGREAGASPDRRADPGVSPVQAGASAVPRSAPMERPSSPERLADMDRPAAYDPDVPVPAAGRAAVPTPAAATPPPATDRARLTAAQAAYMRAWQASPATGAPAR
jgi:hypothetical protein